jgi:hypothetical protein
MSGKVCLCLKNQKVMCTSCCSRPCLVLCSAQERARGRGLGSEASYLCKFEYVKGRVLREARFLISQTNGMSTFLLS